MIELNLPGNIGDYELNHIGPLLLDGLPFDPDNFQMQAWPAARTKDSRSAGRRLAFVWG
jgi:hypothetical protein